MRSVGRELGCLGIGVAVHGCCDSRRASQQSSASVDSHTMDSFNTISQKLLKLETRDIKQKNFYFEHLIDIPDKPTRSGFYAL